jgi:GTP-binding protein
VFVVLVNKWDAVQDRDKARHAVELDLKHRAAHMKRVPVLYISARLRRGLPDVMPLVKELLAKANQKIPTGKLNQFLSEVLSKNPPPLSRGRPVRLKFITQVGTNPPTFALWGNRTAAIPDSYKRYLTNRMADALGLDGISIRITFRGTENPYAAKGQPKKTPRQGGATRRKIHSTPNKRRKG